MVRRIKPEDEGKPLVTPSGHVVGVVDRVRPPTAYVRPDSDLLSVYGSWIAGPIRDDQSFPLDEEAVADIDSDRVVIGRDETDPSRVKRIE